MAAKNASAHIKEDDEHCNENIDVTINEQLSLKSSQN